MPELTRRTIDDRAAAVIDAVLAFRAEYDMAPSPTSLRHVCSEAADLVTFCLARGAAKDLEVGETEVTAA